MTVFEAVAAQAGRMFQQTEPADLRGMRCLTLRRADFKLRWLATRMHTFAFVIDFSTEPVVDLPALGNDTRDWARHHKGGMPAGFQTGCSAMPVVILSASELDRWRGWAEAPQPLRFSAPLFPVLIAADGHSAVYRQKSQRWGIVYESFFRGLAAELAAAAAAAAVS